MGHVFRAQLISFAVPGYPWGKPLQAWREVECHWREGDLGDMARHVTTVWGWDWDGIVYQGSMHYWG